MASTATKERKTENYHYIGRGFTIKDDNFNASPLETQTNGNDRCQIFYSRKHYGHHPSLLCAQLKKVKPRWETSLRSKKIKKPKINAEKITTNRVSSPRSLLPSGVSIRFYSMSSESINPNLSQLAVGGEKFKPQHKQCSDVKPLPFLSERVKCRVCESYNGVKSSESELGVLEKEGKEAHLSWAASSEGDSVKKVARVSMLKSRFADTISRAEMMLAEHSSCNKGVEQRPQWIPRSLSTVAAPTSKSEIQRKRKTARLELERMEKTVDFDDAMVALRELQMLIGDPLQSLARTQSREEFATLCDMDPLRKLPWTLRNKC